MTPPDGEDVTRRLEQERQTIAIANDIALMRSELSKIQADVTEGKTEIIGDRLSPDGIRSKVHRHEEIIQRMTWALAAISSAILAACGKWLWDKLSR